MSAPMTTTALVRLQLAIPGTDEVFTDDQINGFLQLEGGHVKPAAAAALVAIAVNEALVSKVIKDGQLATDGAKLAAELRALAKELRAQHADDLEDSEDGFYFGVVDIVGGC